jgi:hypothetical protein
MDCPGCLKASQLRFQILAAASMKVAVQTSEKLVNSYQSTRRYNPEDSHIENVMVFSGLYGIAWEHSDTENMHRN